MGTRYELIRLIGRGGMGEVWLARDLQLQREVALKHMLGGSEEDRERFMREALTAAQLSHTHIVPIYEVGEHDGKRFIAMKYIDGEPLQKLRIEPRRALAIMRDVARAVHYAHGRGIVHRDLKPANLLLDRDGHVWVMDFGLARPTKGGTTLTLSGAVVGTPVYMPPEQAQGLRATAKSDVYALGATLYELLAARPPFEGQDVLSLLQKACAEDPVPLRRVNVRLPWEAQAIVEKAMEKEPARRYATADELAKDIERYLAGDPIVARPSTILQRLLKRIRKNRLLWASGAAVAALALGFGAYFAFARRALSRAEQEVRQARGTQERLDRWQKAQLAMSGAARVHDECEFRGVKRSDAHRAVVEEALRAAEKIWPGYPDGVFERGRGAYIEDRYDEAVDLFTKALDGHLAVYKVLLYRARCRISTYRSAKGGLLLSGGESDVIVANPRPDTPAEAELLRRAMEDLQRFEAAVPEGAGAAARLLARGLAAMFSGRHREAVGHFEGALKEGGLQGFDWEHFYGLALMWDGRLQDALGQFERMRKVFPGRAEGWHEAATVATLLAVREDRQGRDPTALLEGAGKHFRRSLELRPGFAAALLGLGTVKAMLADRKSDRREEAAALYEEAIACFTQVLKHERSEVAALINRGLCTERLARDKERRSQDGSREYENAERDFTEAIRLLESAPEAWSGRGNLRVELAQRQAARGGVDATRTFEDAVADLARAVELKQDFAEGWYNLGNANRYLAHHRRDRGGNAAAAFARAVDCYARAIGINPRIGALWNNRATTHLEWGDCQIAASEDPTAELEAALSDFARGLETGQQREELLYNRGGAHLLLAGWYETRDRARALRHYRAALADWMQVGADRPFAMSVQSYVQKAEAGVRRCGEPP